MTHGKKRGIGIIGCGMIADIHAAAIQDIETAYLAGVSSRSEERVRQFAEKHRCNMWTTDYHQLLADQQVEVICLTTSSGSHYRIGLDVLEAGKHLIVEKPLAMTSAEAERLIAAAKRNKVKLSVVSQGRFAPQHELAKRMVDENKLGKLLLIEVSRLLFRTQEYYDSASWRGTLSEDGGALMNQGIHSLDLMLWLAGSVSSVVGKMDTMVHQIEAEDMGMGIVEFDNGAYGLIKCSTATSPGFPPELNIYGDRGCIKITGSQIVFWDVPGVERGDSPEQTNDQAGVATPQLTNTKYHRLQIENVLNAISEDTKPLITGEDGRNTIKLIENIRLSSRRGAKVDWDETP